MSSSCILFTPVSSESVNPDTGVPTTGRNAATVDTYSDEQGGTYEQAVPALGWNPIAATDAELKFRVPDTWPSAADAGLRMRGACAQQCCALPVRPLTATVPARTVLSVQRVVKTCLAGGAALAIFSGCSSTPSPPPIGSAGGAPVTVCGKTLIQVNRMPVLHDVSQHAVALRQPSGTLVALRVAGGCEAGVSTTIKPARCATFVGRVDGANGAPVAVAIRVARPGCSFEVRAGGRTVAQIASNVGVKNQGS